MVTKEVGLESQQERRQEEEVLQARKIRVKVEI
jgi:hypothetical protein